MEAGNKRQRPKMNFAAPSDPPQPVGEGRTVPIALSEPPLAGEPEVRQRSRIGRRAVTFYLSQDAFRQLGVLSAQTDRTVQDMMQEATDWLFQKYGQHRIARE